MLRRLNKQSCRNSLDPITQTQHSSPNAKFPLSRFGSIHQGKITHKKFFSTFSSMGQSPLCVRRQQLRQKEKQRCLRVIKQPRMKRKQKTEHFNFKYLQWLKMRKQGMSWIQYNMTLGVAFLWKKVQEQTTYFQKAKKIKYNRKFEQQVDSISQQIDSIIQEANDKTPDFHKENFAKLFKGRDSVEFKSLNYNLAQVQKKLNSRSFQNYYKSTELLKKGKVNRNKEDKGLGSTAIATPNKEVFMGNLKESVSKLNSFFCLFKRRISLQKQDLFIKQFVQRRSSNISFTPQQLQQLEQIMKINQKRCQLMSKIINNVGILRSHESCLQMSQKILKKIGQIDLVKELAMAAEENREEMLMKKMKSCNDLIIEIAQPMPSQFKPTSSAQIMQDSNIFNSNDSTSNVPKPEKRKFFQRSSIENCVSPQKDNYNYVPSKVDFAWKEKITNKSQRLMKEQKVKKAQKQKQKEKERQRQKDSVHIKKLSLKKSKFEQGDKQKPKLKRPHKKGIIFAGIQSQNKQMLQNKSIRSKLKSSKSSKSKRQITWQDIQRRDHKSVKSIKSFKSLKSLKSIGSQSELGSRKFLRSLKTQREMKYLHGHIRDISYASKYRTKLFRLNGLEDEYPNETRDFFDATTYNRQDSEEKQSRSIPEMEQKSRQSIELEMDTSSALQNSEQPQKSITAKSSQISLKEIKQESQQNEQLIGPQLSQQKDKIIQDFIHRFGIIQKENNITKQKFLILYELQKMLDGKIISIQMFQKYRAYFQGQRRSKAEDFYCDKVEADSNKLLKPSHYSHLLNFRKLIQNTTELNQINKYYYNLSQFKCQEEQINKTKQANKKEDFFFHIRSSTEQLKRNHYVYYYRQQKQQWKPRVLQQKDF